MLDESITKEVEELYQKVLKVSQSSDSAESGEDFVSLLEDVEELFPADLADINQRCYALFHAGKSTWERWREGKNIPHPLMRQAILQDFAQKLYALLDRKVASPTWVN